MVGIISQDKNEGKYFTCRNGEIGERHDCLKFEQLKSLKGKNAEIMWFEQKVNIGSTQKRLARLVLEGNEIISLEKTESNINFGEKASALLSIGITFLMVLLVSNFESYQEIKNSIAFNIVKMLLIEGGC